MNRLFGVILAALILTGSAFAQTPALSNAAKLRNTVGGGAGPVITFTPSTTNLLVQFNHGSATPTTINFVIEIDGPVVTYTRG